MRFDLRLRTNVGALALLSIGAAAPAAAGVLTASPDGISFGARWDYAQRTVDLSGNIRERSLANGLTFNMQGGSYEAFRDLFSWAGAKPTVAAFQSAVEQAFDAWTVVDPVSGFGTKLSFRFDNSVAVVGAPTGSTLIADGAEIDLFASSQLFSAGSGTRADTRVAIESSVVLPATNKVTLTSGVSNYSSAPIIGADIILNSQSTASYSLDVFRRLLTHEIGHAIGLGDVDVGTVRFLDDNFDNGNRAATLSNSWAALVNPLNPAASAGLSVTTFTSSQAGNIFNQTSGVDLLMESNGLGVSAANPLTNPTPLTNDEYGMRQFLYPELAPVPEPSAYVLLAAGLATLVPCLRRRKARGDLHPIG